MPVAQGTGPACDVTTEMWRVLPQNEAIKRKLTFLRFCCFAVPGRAGAGGVSRSLVAGTLDRYDTGFNAVANARRREIARYEGIAREHAERSHGGRKPPVP